MSRKSLLLLGLSLLSSCAAGGITADPPGAAASSPYSAYLIGRFAQDNNDLDVAARNLLAARAVDPSNMALLNQTFLACMLAQRPEAVALARQLPDNPLAQLLLGDTAAQSGNWRDAQKSYAALKAPGLAGFLAPLLIAWTQQGGADPDAALATLQPKLQGGPLAGLYALHAAMIADLSDRFPQAQQLYSAALSNSGSNVLRLAQLIANWQERQGHHDDAIETLQAMARANPSLAIVVPAMSADVRTRPVRTAADGLAEVYLSFAVALQQQKNPDTALALLRLALDMRPDLTAARLLMADVLDTGHHADTALRVLAPVGNDDPLSPVVRLRRAELEERLGDFATAEAGLRQLAASLPDQPQPLAALGDLQRQQKNLPAAIATYGQAIARAPAGAVSDWSLYFARAVTEQQTDQWPSAESDLRHALSLQPDEPDVLNFLGYSWADRNEHLEDARRMIERAAQLRPDDGAITDSLGWVMLRQGDTADAVAALEKAVRLDPEDSEINGHLGDAYWAAGRKLQARYQWQLALNLKPEPADVPKLKAKLQQAERATESAKP